MSVRVGSMVDADRWKAHALDALASAAATAAHIGVVDVATDNQLRALAFRLSTL